MSGSTNTSSIDLKADTYSPRNNSSKPAIYNNSTQKTDTTGSNGSSLLKYGNTGSDVLALQSKLQNLGYDTGGLDGVFGNKTQEAIQDIQKRTGITVDGVVGKQTNAALDTLSMQKQVTVKSPISISSQNKTPQNNINSTDTYKQYLEKKEEWLYNGNKDKPSVVDKGNSTNKQNVDKQGTTGTGNSKEGDKVFITALNGEKFEAKLIKLKKDGKEILVSMPMDLEAFGNANKTPMTKETVHTMLDAAGMIPGGGELFDIANAGLYALEKDWKNAGLSGAAAVPILGYFANGIKIVDKGKDAAKVIDKVGDVLDVTKGANKTVFNSGKLVFKH